MSMNPFDELQQYQLGSSLMGQPQVPTPAAQPPVPQLPMAGMPQMPAQQQPQGGVPPRDANELQQRTSGWMSALQELQANPAVAMALLQMGTALTGGKKFNTALGMGLGAMGRVGAMQEGYRQRGLAEEMAQKKMGLEERKFGLDERQLTAQEKMWEAQTRNYERLARGGGGGGGGTSTAAMMKRWAELKAWRMSVNGKDEKEAEAFADYSTFGSSRLPKPPKAGLSDLEKIVVQNYDPMNPYDPNSKEGRIYARVMEQEAGGGGPSIMDPKSEAEAHLKRMERSRFGTGGRAPGAQATPPTARAPNAALGGITPMLEKRATQTAPYDPRQILEAARDGTLDIWAKQGWDVKSDILAALNSNVLGAKDALELRRYLEKY